MLFIRRSLPHLLFFFFLSVVIRLPNIGRPLSKHHEFCTAISLRVIQVWYESGIRQYAYNPVMTYPDPANRYINNFASGSGKMIDGQGHYYYVSHPPLGYYVPFAFFKATHIYPSVTAIQYFNLSLHFLCALGVFWIVLVLQGRNVTGSNFTAFAAYLLYLFSPATLWFQSNTYMADMFVQLPFVFGILSFLLLQKVNIPSTAELHKREFAIFSRHQWALAVLLCTIVFLTVYSSWLGVFFAAAVACYWIIKGWKNRKLWLLAGGVILAAIASLTLTFFQYSRINGIDAYIAEALERASERSISAITSLPSMYFTIAENYIFNYLPLLLLLALLIISGRKNVIEKLRSFRSFLFVAGLPVLLLHLVLTNYSGHDFTTLYAAPVLAVTAAFLIRDNATFMHNRQGLIALTIMIGIVQYYFINLPGDNSQSGDRYDLDMKAGIKIAEQSKANEVVFLAGQKPDPQMIFYAHRNIQQVADEKEAKAFLMAYGKKAGVLFVRKSSRTPWLEKRISLP